MRRLQVSQDIVPIGKFKAHASRLLRDLRKDQRPLVITQNGKPAAVLVSPEEFDRLTEREQFLSAVREGLADSEAGRVVSEDELTKELDRALGPLER